MVCDAFLRNSFSGRMEYLMKREKSLFIVLTIINYPPIYIFILLSCQQCNRSCHMIHIIKGNNLIVEFSQISTEITIESYLQKFFLFSLKFLQIAHPNILSSPFPLWLPPTGQVPGPGHLGSLSFVYLLT